MPTRRIPPVVLLAIVWTAQAAPAAADPRTADFWVGRAAREVAAAPAVEYDGPALSLTAFEAAADLCAADPSPAHRRLLAEKLAAGEAQLAHVTQPWRRWQGGLVLARVYRAVAKDEAAYNRHSAAAAALIPFLAEREKNAATYALVRGCETAAAGDAATLRKEAAAAATGVPAQLEWYARVAHRCASLGLADGARAALDQLAADASVLPRGPDLDLGAHLLASEYALIGEYAGALEAVADAEGPRKFDAAVRVLRAARRDGRADVTKVVRAELADVLPPTFGPFAGDYVRELAAAGDPRAAAIGRDALKRGPGGDPAPFFTSLAVGLAAAGERQASAVAVEHAGRAIEASTDPTTRARALLSLATAHALAGEWDVMTRCGQRAAAIEGVAESDLAGERAALVDALLAQKRWDDAARQIAPVRALKDREAWTPRIVAAQVRAGETDLAIANTRKVEGFVRARAWRGIAIERAKRGDLDGLAAWVDQLDTPLRRAATNLAIAQVLAGKPVRSSGFPLHEE